MARDRRVSKRLKELNNLFSKIPANRRILLKSTIETVATMDVMMMDLEKKIDDGTATTPDKQLYASTAKTRESSIKILLRELPAEEDEGDGFDDF